MTPSAWTEHQASGPAGGVSPAPPAGNASAREPERVEDPPAGDLATREPDERLLRAMADLENLRKRSLREVERARDAERIRVATEWLPVVDDLDRAVEHAPQDRGDPHSLLEGVRAVRDHAIAILSRLGFPRYGEVGEPFDPARHDAVSAVDIGGPPGTVVAVVRPGYGNEQTILRPAGVVVARS
ncbi:MAG: nucleotide exchange factor GrpE [Acidimicrobiia bacterium]|nr:nucleotide exchange factor GrpE [Acidimicrobiia bacterium]